MRELSSLTNLTALNNGNLGKLDSYWLKTAHQKLESLVFILALNKYYFSTILVLF